MAISSLGVQEVSTTSGVGPYTLLGPTPDHWMFRDKIANNSTVTYEANDGARSEYGLGRFEFPATLHRQNIINSSEGDFPVNWPVSGQCIISLVTDDTGGLPPGGDCAQALIKISPADFDAAWQWRPYPIAVWIDGSAGANRRIRIAITEQVLFFGNFPLSVAYADTAPTANIDIAINRLSPPPDYFYTAPSVSSPLGVITFLGGVSTGTWSSGGLPQQLQPGDRIEFLFPALTNTIADVSITARGVIICGA